MSQLEVALDYWTFGVIANHRRITPKEVGAELGIGPRQAARLMAGKGSEAYLQGMTLTLDRALSRITARRGGILAACGCTKAAVAELAIDVHKGDYWNAR